MALDFNGGGAFSPFSAADMTFSAFADTVALTRKFHRQIMERIPDANYLKDGLLEDVIAGGGLLGVASDTVNVYHAEQESVVSNITVLDVTPTTTGSNTGTLLISGTDLTKGGVTQSFIYALVGQIFSTNDPGVQLIVTSVSTTPVSSTNDYNIGVALASGLALATYVADNDVLRPLGSSVSADSLFGTGSVRGWSRFGVTFQTQETVAGPLPTNAYNQTFEFTMGNGQNVLAPRVLLDAYVRDDLKKMAQVIAGTGETLNGLPTTMGIFKTIQTYGQTQEFTGAGSGGLGWADFLEINDFLRNRGAGTERDLWMGAKVFDTIQQNFGTDFTLQLRYVNADGNLGDAHTNLGVGFGQFASSEVTYTMKRMNELSHPRIFSNAGDGALAASGDQYYANCFMILPSTKMKIQNGLTSRTQAVEAPMMRILQLEAPVTVGGPKVMKRVYNQAGAELGKENYKVTMRQDFALQMMLAYKCFFGGYNG
jgi:hypothetical protein